MNQTLFIRLLHHENKEKVLADKISSLKEGHQDKDIYTVSPNSFCNVPNTPFCYWVSDRIRRLFTELSPFESNGRTAQQGASTKDDFRFLRAWWEVPARGILDAANGPDRRDDLTYFKEWCKNRTFQGKRWVMFAKGGGYKPFYADVHLVVNWEKDANELEMFLLKRYPYLGHSANWVLHRESFYFLPGLTWTKRAGRFNPWPLPAGCIFSERAYTAFVPDSELLSTYSILNSKVWDFLFRTMLGRFGHPEFLVGISKKLPWPLKIPFKNDIASKALKSVMESLSNKEHTLLFRCLSLQNNHDTISVLGLYQDFDRIGYEAYGVENGDEAIIEEVYAERFMEEQSYEDKIREVDNDLLNSTKKSWPNKCFSHALGCTFTRWDIRIALDPSLAPKLPDPFDPLPVCPPGMLVGSDGLPAEPGCIVSEEWLRARPDAITLPPENTVKNPTITDADYPLRISWDGILVDDPGFNSDQTHHEDLVRRVREVLDVIWKDKAADIEQKACDILNVPDLRTWFRKSFFIDHIRRYSKSRRKAPIYWQLSTPSASYSVWLYYQRFTKDTFYKVLNDFITPKLRFEERELTNTRQQYGPGPTAGQRKEISARETFVAELKTFKDEVARIAPLWNPDLNDGVIINFSPLWRLVPQNRSWKKECKIVWDKLIHGDYDWAHLAMHLWPERVVPKCIKDRSLAIAHDLDEFFWEEDDKGKSQPKKVSKETVEALIAERTSPTVKAALEDLLNASDVGKRGGKKRPGLL